MKVYKTVRVKDGKLVSAVMDGPLTEMVYKDGDEFFCSGASILLCV